MTISIDQAYVKTYESNLRHLVQQGKSKLRPYVMERAQTTSKNVWPRIASTTMAAKTGARQATPESDYTFSNRVATPATYHDATTYEADDISQMLIDPGSAYLRAQAMAAGRTIDDIIIAAALASAADESGSTTALPSGQKNGGDADIFDDDLIHDTAAIFMANDVDPDVRKIYVITPTAAKSLLGNAKATSSDYASVKALAMNGFVANYCGFDFVVSNRLPANGSYAGTKKCIAFTQDAIGLLVAKDIWTEVGKDASYSFMWRVYSALQMGAVRLDDKLVVETTIESA